MGVVIFEQRFHCIHYNTVRSLPPVRLEHYLDQYDTLLADYEMLNTWLVTARPYVRRLAVDAKTVVDGSLPAIQNKVDEYLVRNITQNTINSA